MDTADWAGVQPFAYDATEVAHATEVAQRIVPIEEKLRNRAILRFVPSDGQARRMYHIGWGLRETPFRARLDPRFFYKSPIHDEALARLHFLVDDRRRVGVLMGQTGSGKSLLLNVFAAEMRDLGRPTVTIGLLGVDQAGLLWQLATDLGVAPERDAQTAVLWQAIGDRLTEYRYQQLSTVVLLDDADRAKPDAIALVARLAQYDLSPEARLTIVLAGRQQTMGRLGRTLLELAELRIDLEPWEPADTDRFLRESLSRAGCQKRVFDDSAVERLHELGSGVPRRISHLADLSLLAGAAENLTTIDAETVESVYEELGVVRV
jgi:general secretion pathway protein A